MATSRTRFTIPILPYARTSAVLITQATNVAAGIDGQPQLFSTLAALNVTLKADTATLKTAEAEVKSPDKGPDAVPTRDGAMDTVREDLRDVRQGLRKVVLANPVAEGDAIVAKAAYKPRKARAPRTPTASFTYGGNPGTVRGRIPCPAPRKRFTTFWGASADSGKTWSDDANELTTYMFEALTIGGTYVFRYRTKVGTTSTAWTVSQPMLIK